MLTITVPATGEKWDPQKQLFVTGLKKDYTFNVEHSLVSISKWEQKYHKPFLSDEEKTYEETCDYVKCMTITQNIPDEVYENLPDDVVLQINDYIKDRATATWFNERAQQEGASRTKKEIITNEIVYYWMIELNIPIKFETWHFNRLMTLIRVIEIKREENDPNAKKNKMSRRDILEQNAKLNAARRKALHSKG